VKLDRSPRYFFFTLCTVDIPSGLLEAIHLSFLTLASVAIAEPALSSSDLKALLNAVPAHHGLAELTLHAQGRDKLNLLIPPDESAADAASCFTKLRTALVKTYSGNQHVLYHRALRGAAHLRVVSSCKIHGKDVKPSNIESPYRILAIEERLGRSR
jgi:hypothetical protein